MSDPIIEFFDRDGTWTRPEHAAAVDVLVVAGGGGGSLNADGQPGEAQVTRFTAPDIPETVDIQVGKGGRGVDGGQDGRDGCVVVVTHLEGGDGEAPDWLQLIASRPGVVMECGCPFDYPYTCPSCGYQRITNHCPHDGVQNPCPQCGHIEPGKRTPLQVIGGPEAAVAMADLAEGGQQ